MKKKGLKPAVLIAALLAVLLLGCEAEDISAGMDDKDIESVKDTIRETIEAAKESSAFGEIADAAESAASSARSTAEKNARDAAATAGSIVKEKAGDAASAAGSMAKEKAKDAASAAGSLAKEKVKDAASQAADIAREKAKDAASAAGSMAIDNFEKAISGSSGNSTSSLTAEDIALTDVDGNGKNYVFSYKGEEFTAIYTTDNWKIMDSYRITDLADMKVICQALIDENPVHGKDMVSYRTADDMVYEWQLHNMGYAYFEEGSTLKAKAKDVDFDPDDQGKGIEEFFESRTGKKIDMDDIAGFLSGGVLLR